MRDILKNWKTSLIGLIALIGLGINVFSNGLSVNDFIALVVGVGFILSKDGDKSHSKTFTVDREREYPDERG